MAAKSSDRAAASGVSKIIGARNLSMVAVTICKGPKMSLPSSQLCASPVCTKPGWTATAVSLAESLQESISHAGQD